MASYLDVDALAVKHRYCFDEGHCSNLADPDVSALTDG